MGRKGKRKKAGGLIAKCISADALKWIAVISMCIDHTAAVVLKGYFQLRMEEIPREQWRIWENAYDIMRAVGRMAFPLFAFLLVEGFCHTRSRRNMDCACWRRQSAQRFPMIWRYADKYFLWRGRIRFLHCLWAF